MKNLLAGVASFNHNADDRLRSQFKLLAEQGQHPRALFIGCADSRVVPALLTQSGPGDLFTIRNIGNIVPPYSASENDSDTGCADHSVGAALDYAIHVLKIRAIIVCGHSECGAMKAIYQGESLASYPHLEAWLQKGQASLERARAIPNQEGLFPHNHLAQCNVLTALDNLRAYPPVREAMQSGQLELHGWYFDIAHAEVSMYDAAQNRFEMVDERMADSGNDWLSGADAFKTAEAAPEAHTQANARHARSQSRRGNTGRTQTAAARKRSESLREADANQSGNVAASQPHSSDRSNA